MKKIKYLLLSFESLQMNSFDVPKFRGYLAHKYSNFDLIHNHLENGRFRYSYPSIQFKVIGKTPAIVALEEGIDVIKKVFLEIDEIMISGKSHRSTEKSIIIKSADLGECEEVNEYSFISPWMALNQDNHAEYMRLNRIEREEFLERILIGNIKSICKGFGYWIPDAGSIRVRSRLNSVARNFKDLRMECFAGSFRTNFRLPDYLGLGKQTARGFGCVIKEGI